MLRVLGLSAIESGGDYDLNLNKIWLQNFYLKIAYK